MTQAPTTDPEDIASPQDQLIDTVTASHQEVLETAEAAGKAVYQGLTQLQRGMADFVAARIRQDMETQQAFLRCRSMDDVRQVQARFIRTAFDQYSAEAARVLKLGGDLASRSLDRGAD